MGAHRGLALLVAVVVAGCPTTEDDDHRADDDIHAGDDDLAAEPCAFLDAPAISVEVIEEVIDGAPRARIHAWVGDSRFPAFHEIASAEGACRYLSLAYGNCDPPCDPGAEVCIAGDVCEPYPVGVAAGVLDIDGLAVPVSIEANEWSPGSYWATSNLPSDIHGPGDVITATFGGDALSSMSLVAEGVETLHSAIDGAYLELRDGLGAEVTWTPGPDPEVCVGLWVNGVSTAHGLPLADVIHCGCPSGSDT